MASSTGASTAVGCFTTETTFIVNYQSGQVANALLQVRTRGGNGSESTSDGTFRMTVDPDWDSVNGYSF